MNYTANYSCREVCSVIHKWHLRFYLPAHSDFGFFSFVGYLHLKDYIKSVKKLLLNLGLNNLYRLLAKSLLKLILWPSDLIVQKYSNGYTHNCPITIELLKNSRKFRYCFALKWTIWNFYRLLQLSVKKCLCIWFKLPHCKIPLLSPYYSHFYEMLWITFKINK